MEDEPSNPGLVSRKVFSCPFLCHALAVCPAALGAEADSAWLLLLTVASGLAGPVAEYVSLRHTPRPVPGFQRLPPQTTETQIAQTATGRQPV